MKETAESESHKQKEKDEIVQDADFAVDLTDSETTLERMLCKLGDHTFVNFHGHARNRRQFHAAAELISLDTGLRMEGLPAVTLWDTVIDMFEPPASRARRDPSRQLKPKTLQARQESSDTAHLSASICSHSRSIRLQWQPRSNTSFRVMAATRETSRFGEGPMTHSCNYVRNIAKQNHRYVRKARRKWQCRSRRLARAEGRTEQRLRFCELQFICPIN